MVGAMEYIGLREESLTINDYEMVSIPFWNGILYDDFLKARGISHPIHVVQFK